MVKQKEILTIAQCEQFMQSAKTIQEKLMIEMMLMCGLRISELINCQISWINLEDKLLYIQENNKTIDWNPEYCSIREVSLPEKLLIKLKQFIGNRNKKFKEFPKGILKKFRST